MHNVATSSDELAEQRRCDPACGRDVGRPCPWGEPKRTGDQRAEDKSRKVDGNEPNRFLRRRVLRDERIANFSSESAEIVRFAHNRIVARMNLSFATV
jgi:hypothetical protein